MRTPGSGRKAGTPNKDTKTLMERCEALKVDPFEILAMTAKGDWKGLGFKPTLEHITGPGGQPLTREKEPVIELDLRVQAAKEMCQYLYPKRKAIELTADEDSGFKIVIEDYRGEKKKE